MDQPRRLALIECLDHDGQVLRAESVTRWPLTIGRALDCDLVLDDPHVAARHLSLQPAPDGSLQLQVGDTLNGVELAGAHLAAGRSATLASGQILRLGGTRLRLRLAGDTLAPERPLARHQLREWAQAGHAGPAVRWRTLLGWALVALAWLMAGHWLESDPGTPAASYLTAGLSALTGVLAWSFFWAVGNKLFQRRLHFSEHLGLALRHLLLWLLLSAALPLAAYAFDLPLLARIDGHVGWAVAAALVYAHLARILPGHRQALGVGVAAFYLCAMGLTTWLNIQRLHRPFGELYLATLPPPALRVAPLQPAQALIDDARDLRTRLDRQATEDEAEDAGSDEDTPDDGQADG